jgi:3-oxoacyl-[acyl-carrier protein] reductase
VENVANSRVTAKASDVANSINQSGGQALAVAGDLLNDAHIPELVKKAAEFGNGKLHIIVNNAGFTWDGVIHRVRGPSAIDCNIFTDLDNRQLISSGIPCLLFTARRHSS